MSGRVSDLKSHLPTGGTEILRQPRNDDALTGRPSSRSGAASQVLVSGFAETEVQQAQPNPTSASQRLRFPEATRETSALPSTVLAARASAWAKLRALFARGTWRSEFEVIRAVGFRYRNRFAELSREFDGGPPLELETMTRPRGRGMRERFFRAACADVSTGSASHPSARRGNDPMDDPRHAPHTGDEKHPMQTPGAVNGTGPVPQVAPPTDTAVAKGASDA